MLARPELSRTDPNLVAPSMKVTVPVGVPAVAVTVAVKVTRCPLVEGFSEETSVVVVVAFTNSMTDGDVLVKKFASPLYTAVIVWFPGASAEVVTVA